MLAKLRLSSARSQLQPCGLEAIRDVRIQIDPQDVETVSGVAGWLYLFRYPSSTAPGWSANLKLFF